MKKIIQLLFLKKHIVLFICCLLTVFTKGDTNIQQRLASLKSTIPLTYNDQTQSYIDWYVNNPDSTAKSLALWTVYAPIIEKVLKDNGQPAELKYLAFAMSNMNNQLVNRGASGIWQMLFDDAKTKYKLKINSMVDERRDIEKCTQAVALYFKDLLALYNDWYLAMTAYRSTTSAMNKTIIQAGANMNYWSLYPFINDEYREIVPRFVAAAYIVNFHSQHGIKAGESSYSFEYDSVKVEQQLSFTNVSEVLGIPLKQIEFLNPQYKTGIVPFAVNHYLLRLPKGQAENFHQKKNSIYTYVAEKPLSESPTIEKGDTTIKKEAKTARVAYKVRNGESLITIADYFDCTVGALKSMNGIRNRTNTIKPGRILYFIVSADTKNYYAAINAMTASQKKKLARKD